MIMSEHALAQLTTLIRLYGPQEIALGCQRICNAEADTIEDRAAEEYPEAPEHATRLGNMAQAYRNLAGRFGAAATPDNEADLIREMQFAENVRRNRQQHCGARVPNMGQSLCTRPAGHAGDHRCSAADVDARQAAR